MPETVQTLTTLSAECFRVTEGVARGEAMGFADELILDDLYELDPAATTHALALIPGESPSTFTVAPDSAAGRAGNRVILDSCLTLMIPDGGTVEILVLVEVESSIVAAVHLLPLAPLLPRVPCRLIGIDRDGAARRLAEVACVSFTRGTRITLGSGRQVPVEELRIGDMVLTRAAGPQPIRWIGEMTLRATGAFAPVLIRRGTLHNENDLLLSPQHRVFVWQREDQLGAGRAEALVRVQHLINGETVRQIEGGFVDYFQLVLDDHQIIYAEGIAAESLLVDPHTRAAVAKAGLEQGRSRHIDHEVPESLLTGRGAADLLRRASR